MERVSNTRRILNLLKNNSLTSDDIAETLELSKQDVRTYLLRLRNEDKVKVIGKTGRFYIYTYKNPETNLKPISEELEHELIESISELSDKFYDIYKDALKMKDEYIESLEQSFDSKEELINSFRYSNKVKNTINKQLLEENERLKTELKNLKEKIKKLTG